MNSKTFTLGGAVALAIGLFLPILSAPGISVNLFSPPDGVSIDGIIILVCAVLAAILALLSQTRWAVLPALATLGLLVVNYLNIQNQGAGDAINFTGWAVMGIGAVMILVGGFMGWKKA